MNILEFIETQYPIKDIVKERLADPYTRIAQLDCLPYDIIGPDSEGHLTKLVEISDTRTISVMELIAYTREDIVKLNDLELLNVWEAYMEEVDIEDLNVSDIMACVKQYKMMGEERKNRVLSLQENT